MKLLNKLICKIWGHKYVSADAPSKGMDAYNGYISKWKCERCNHICDSNLKTLWECVLNTDKGRYETKKETNL